MTDVATLRFKVDSSELAAASRELDGVTAAAGRTQGASDALLARMDRLGQSFMTVGRNLSLFVTTPMLAAGGAAAKMAIDAEETASKFDVVFRGSVERSRAALEALTATVPLTRSEMEAMSAGIQDMIVPMGVARDQAADMSVGFIELAADMGSFSNVGTDKVLMDIQSALAGSSEPMRKYGVDTRATRLEQIALRDGLIGVGEELDQASRAVATMTAIIEDTADASGDAARTVGSVSNQLRLFGRDVRQLMEDLGRAMIPTLQRIVPILRGWVESFAALSAEHQTLILVVAGLVTALGPALVVFGAIVKAAVALAPVLVSVKTAVVALAAPFAAIVGAIAAAAIAIERKFVPGMQQVGLMAQIVNVLQRAFVVLSGVIKGVAELAMALGTTVLGAFRAIVAPIEGLVTTASTAMQALINRDFAAAKDAALGIGQAITEASVAGQQQVADGVAGMRDAIVTNVQDTVERVTKLQDELLGVGDAANEAGRDAEDGMDDFGGALESASETMLLFSEGAETVSGSIETVTTGTGEATLAVAEFEQKLQQQLGTLRTQRLEIKGGTRAVLEFELAQLRAAGATDEQIDRLQSMIDEVIEAESEVERLTESTRKMTSAGGEAGEQIGALAGELPHLQSELEETAWHFQQMEGIARQSLSDLSSAFSAFITGEIGSFSDFVGEINTILQQGLTDSVNQVMNRAMSGGPGSLGGSDWATLGLGALGGLGGMIGGRTGGAISGLAGGAQLGMQIGSIIPGIGNVVGGIVGGILGSVAGFFGADKDPRLEVGGVRNMQRDPNRLRAQGNSVETALGETFFRFRGIEDAARKQIMDGIKEFDKTVANMIDDPNQLGRIRTALENMNYYATGDNINFEDVIRIRLEAVVHSFEDFERGLIESEKGIENQMQIMSDILSIQGVLPDLAGFNQIGDEEFLSTINALRQGTETLGQAFERITGAFIGYADMAAGLHNDLATSGLNEFQSAMVNIQLESNAAREALNAQAKAAGLSAARTEDMAALHERTAMRMAAVIAQMEDAGRTLVEGLFGTELSRLMDQVASARAGGASDSELASELERIAQLEAEEANRQRLLQGQQLAQIVADIAQASGDNFEAVANRLGFDLEQLAEVLGVDQSGLVEQLEAMQVDPMALAYEIQSQTDAIVGELIRLPGSFANALYGFENPGETPPGPVAGDETDEFGPSGAGTGSGRGENFERVETTIASSIGETTTEVAGLRGDVSALLEDIAAGDQSVAAAINNLARALNQSGGGQTRSTRTRARIEE